MKLQAHVVWKVKNKLYLKVLKNLGASYPILITIYCVTALLMTRWSAQ